MAFVHNGVTLPTSSNSIYFNSTAVQKVIHNNTTVWLQKAPPGSQTFTSSTTLTAGVHFPADTTLNVLVLGGGGGGAGNGMPPTATGIAYAGGGYAGQVTSGTVAGYSSGQTVNVTIGSGGSSVLGGGNGGAGGSSSFGSITASGGAGGVRGVVYNYVGNGGAINTSFGSSVDGLSQGGQVGVRAHVAAYGGQGSGAGNGGNAKLGASGDAGGVGAGGGASGQPDAGQRAGAGGRGEVRISW